MRKLRLRLACIEARGDGTKGAMTKHSLIDENLTCQGCQDPVKIRTTLMTTVAEKLRSLSLT